jgi:hypothetical protein
MNMNLMKDEHPRTIARAAVLIYRTKRGLSKLVQRLKNLTWPGLRLSLDVEAYIVPNVFETERDVIRALETKLKWAYCREVGSDSIVGLEQCDKFYDWVARIDNPRLRQNAQYALSEAERSLIALALSGLAIRHGGSSCDVVLRVADKIDATRFLTSFIDDYQEHARSIRDEARV